MLRYGVRVVPEGRKFLRSRVTARFAANALLAAFAALAVFHVCVLSGVMPVDMVWGGRAANTGQGLIVLEVVALIVTLLFAAIVAARVGYVGASRLAPAVRIGMWVVFVYFLLSILGNLASTSALERAIFTPTSAVLAVLALRVASEAGPDDGGARSDFANLDPVGHVDRGRLFCEQGHGPSQGAERKG